VQTVTFSKSALAVLRLRAKGLRLPVRDLRLEAYRELADMGIMEPDGDDFRFTEDGWARREELICAAETHLRSMEPRLPERIEISRAASRTLARHLAGDKKVSDANRDAYRELARAGIMESVGTFIQGDDCVFQLTHQGWERRHEFQRPLPRFSASAMRRKGFMPSAYRIGDRRATKPTRGALEPVRAG
jgi:hypothetical protein